MIMELPKKFYAPYCTLLQGILYITSSVSYESMMYDLTYALRNQICVYCNTKVKRKANATLDHRYPRSTGGVSITNNLFICCDKCNSQKGSLTHEEFLAMKKLPKERRSTYIRERQLEKERILKAKGFILPPEWISEMKIEAVSCSIFTNPCSHGKKYYRQKEFFETYNHLSRPIITDRNGVLLDGFTTYTIAVENHLDYIPAIKLENVVRVF